MYHRPSADLTRIPPDTEKSTDILRQPDEEADENECQKKRHASFPIKRPKDHGRARIQPQRARCDIPPVVTDIVVREEIGVNEQGVESPEFVAPIRPKPSTSSVP
jgi:hypothetical protein